MKPAMMIFFTLTLPLFAATAHAQYRGTTRAAYDMPLAMAVDGHIASIEVRPGDRIEPGQVLVQLDDTLARQVVELAQIKAADREPLELATAQLARARAAYETAPTPDHERMVQEAEARIARCRQELQTAQIELEIAQIRLRQHTLTAPAAGRIETLVGLTGQFVRTGEPIGRLVDAGTLHVEVAIPSERMQTLAPGDTATVHVGAEPDALHVSARIIFIAQTLDEETDTRLVRLEMGNADLGILPGTRVTVTFAGREP